MAGQGPHQQVVDLPGGDQHGQRMGAAAGLEGAAEQPVRIERRFQCGHHLMVGTGGEFVADLDQGLDAGRGQPPAARLPPLEGVEGDVEQLGEGFLAEPG